MAFSQSYYWMTRDARPDIWRRVYTMRFRDVRRTKHDFVVIPRHNSAKFPNHYVTTHKSDYRSHGPSGETVSASPEFFSLRYFELPYLTNRSFRILRASVLRRSFRFRFTIWIDFFPNVDKTPRKLPVIHILQLCTAHARTPGTLIWLCGVKTVDPKYGLE